MKRNPALEHLNIFVGEWDIDITSMPFQADKTAVVHGRASFAWTEDGAFLYKDQFNPRIGLIQSTL